MMKVMHLIGSGGFYGAESVVVNLGTELMRLGCDFRLCVFENRGQTHKQIVNKAVDSGLNTKIISSNGRLDLKSWSYLRNYLLSEKADILHTHGYKADVYGFATSIRSPISLVATCHNWTNATRNVRAYGMLDKLILSRFDRVVAVSSTVQQLLERARVRKDRVRIIPNGVRVTSHSRSKDQHNVTLRIGSYTIAEILSNCDALVGFVGRLTEQKGIVTLLRASAPIIRKNPRVKVLIAGEGPDRQIFESLTRELGIAENTYFVGFCEQVSSLYELLDVFVLPSYSEGLPMSLLEAMGSGTAVVASRVGGIPVLIENWQSGVLISPGNVPELTSAISDLIEKPEQRQKIGENARSVVATRFSAAEMARSYLDLYRDLIASSQTKPASFRATKNTQRTQYE